MKTAVHDIFMSCMYMYVHDVKCKYMYECAPQFIVHSTKQLLHNARSSSSLLLLLLLLLVVVVVVVVVLLFCGILLSIAYM